MEIHLFIIWSKANTKKKKILSDIVNKFTILDVYNISWTKEKFSENLSRFYGQNLPANSKKEQHCGNETFTCIIVKDFNPKYERRQTSKGLRIVNVNLFDRTSNAPPEISSGSSMFIIDAGTAECSEPLPGECSHTCDECPSTSVTLGELLTINDIDGDVINYNWRVTSGSCSDSEYESRDLCENAGKNWNANAEIENPNDLTPIVSLTVGAPAAPDHCQVEKF